MFDYHLHSTVSFDGQMTPKEVIAAAKASGMKEICFTDHIDYMKDEERFFTKEEYLAAYEGLTDDTLTLRFGVEYGITPRNAERAKRELAEIPYDFVLGSVHSVRDLNTCNPAFWEKRATRDAYRDYLNEVLDTLRVNDNFDSLGHLTYVCKVIANPDKFPILYKDEPELLDAILSELAKKDKGLEINTSSLSRTGGFLPTPDVVRRFKELGGKIITVGSDAHITSRVGEYCLDACLIAKEIFGYVCTFKSRQPIFHKL